MRVEAECIFLRRVKGDKVLEPHKIPPGDWKGIEFLGEGIKIAVFCSTDETGSILIKDPKKKAKVFRYENPDDLAGEEMDSGSRIEVIGEQQVTIFPKVRNPSREVFIFLSSENDQDQGIDLQNDFEEKSVGPLPFAA